MRCMTDTENESNDNCKIIFDLFNISHNQNLNANIIDRSAIRNIHVDNANNNENAMSQDDFLKLITVVNEFLHININREVNYYFILLIE